MKLDWSASVGWRAFEDDAPDDGLAAPAHTFPRDLPYTGKVVLSLRNGGHHGWLVLPNITVAEFVKLIEENTND